MNWKEKKERLLKQAREIAAKCEAEDRDFTSEERQKISNLLEEAKECDEKIKQQKADDDLKDQIDAMNDEFQKAKRDDGDNGREPNAKAAEGKTLGEQFVNAKRFQAWMEDIAPNGRIPESTRGLHSPAVEFKSLLGRKDLIVGDDDTSAGAFVETDYTGIYEPLGRYALNILNLISRRQTNSDVVEFVRQTQRVQEADPTQESNVTEYSGATGEISGEKPEGATKFEKVQANVKTLPVWIPATKRALSDAAQLRGIIDQELRDDLMEELEDQIVNGNGVGENFTGIFNTAGILAQAFNTDILTTARQAITTLEVTGRASPTAFVLHPQDWETVELTQDDNGRYYYAGPQQQGPRTLWGVPVVTSQSLTQGTGLVGDFRKAILWDRMQATITVSDSHEDFFIRNMIAILAEMRAAFGLIRPSAFVELDLEAGS